MLIAGGLSLLPIVNIPIVSATAYEYSATLNTFGFPRFMGQARLLHSAVRLANGKVLVVGGLGLDLTAFLASGDLTQLGVSTHADGELYTPGLFGSFASAGFVDAMRSAVDEHGLSPDEFAARAFAAIHRGDYWIVPQPEALDPPLAARNAIIAERRTPTFFEISEDS